MLPRGDIRRPRRKANVIVQTNIPPNRLEIFRGVIVTDPPAELRANAASVASLIFTGDNGMQIGIAMGAGEFQQLALAMRKMERRIK
jgi:hypothetical protein